MTSAEKNRQWVESFKNGNKPKLTEDQNKYRNTIKGMEVNIENFYKVSQDNNQGHEITMLISKFMEKLEKKYNMEVNYATISVQPK